MNENTFRYELAMNITSREQNMPPSREPILERQPLFTPHRRGKWDLYYRCPNLIISKKGTVFAFPSPKFNIITDWAKIEFSCRRSFDHGRTWTDTEVLRTDEDPHVGFGYASGVADLETGRVLVFYAAIVVITPQDIGGQWMEQWENGHAAITPKDIGNQWVEQWENEHPEEAAVLRRKLAPQVEPGLYLVWTDDEGESWSDPRPVGDELYAVNPVTGARRPTFAPQWVGAQLRYSPKRGRLILPGRGTSQGSTLENQFAYDHNYVVYSDDHGHTWQPGGLTQNGTGEACLVEETDGTIYVNSRAMRVCGSGGIVPGIAAGTAARRSLRPGTTSVCPNPTAKLRCSAIPDPPKTSAACCSATRP